MKHFLKRLGCLALCAGLLLSGCQKPEDQPPPSDYHKYTSQFFDTFDTIIQVVGYTKTQEEFTGYADAIHQRFVDLSHQYDRFYEYTGVNNIKTINLNAGVAPVAVSKDVLDMLEFAKGWCEKTGGKVNIALGPVLEVWHSYMELYAGGAPGAALPTPEELAAANAHTDLSKVIIDRAAGTVFLAEAGMALDVGAVAKGYAAQVVADELYAAGLHSFIISAGGNVVTKDPPLDNLRTHWGIGIQDPAANPDDPNSKSLDVVFAKNQSVITSGDYQRFYMVGNRRVHHIIDATTLMPADHYRALTVVTDDSGLGDFMSTCLFVMDYESSRAFAQEHGVQAMWVFADGRVEVTDGLLPMLRDRGGATAALHPAQKGASK